MGFNWYTALFVLGKGKNMEFTESLKKNYQFRFVYNRGKSIANRLLVMYVVRNGTDGNRFGISVSKKVGNSVVRSRITRLLRESYRLSESKFLAGGRAHAWSIEAHETRQAENAISQENSRYDRRQSE